MLWGNPAYCVKLSGEDLSRYSNKIESVRIITILLRKWCHNNKHFSEPAPHQGGKTAGIDMITSLSLYVYDKTQMVLNHDNSIIVSNGQEPPVTRQPSMKFIHLNIA